MNNLLNKIKEKIPLYKNGSKATPKDDIVIQLSSLPQILEVVKEEVEKIDYKCGKHKKLFNLLSLTDEEKK